MMILQELFKNNSFLIRKIYNFVFLFFFSFFVLQLIIIEIKYKKKTIFKFNKSYGEVRQSLQNQFEVLHILVEYFLNQYLA